MVSPAPGLGLVEPNAPTFDLVPDDGDNLDALDLYTTLPELSGAIFFSMDSDFNDFNEDYVEIAERVGRSLDAMRSGAGR